MQRKRKEDREASKATEDVTKNTFAHHDASLSEADAKVAAEIRSRVEAEAKRKLETGDFSSGPGKLKVSQANMSNKGRTDIILDA